MFYVQWCEKMRHSGGDRAGMKPNTSVATGSHKTNGNRNDPLGANSEIGRKLKQYYDELITEEVPDKFADLLKQLEDRETSSVADFEGK